MSTHLAHKLPWTDLCESLMLETEQTGKRRRVRIDVSGAKKIRHWSRCLMTTLLEFAKTDKTSDNHFDPTNWDEKSITAGGCGHLPYRTSIISSYIQLNLLLVDAETRKIIFRSVNEQNLYNNWAFECCAGSHDGNHPEWIAKQFRYFYCENDGRWILEEPTADILTSMRKHASLLFKCLYMFIKNHPGQTAISEEEIISVIAWNFELGTTDMGPLRSP
jgi:hypothetical protein